MSHVEQAAGIGNEQEAAKGGHDQRKRRQHDHGEEVDERQAEREPTPGSEFDHPRPERLPGNRGEAAAGEDMLLICSTPETIRRGYRALLEAAHEGKVTEKRINASLKRIAATKALAQSPPPFDLNRYKQLSDEILEMDKTLEYKYPGESNVS